MDVTGPALRCAGPFFGRNRAAFPILLKGGHPDHGPDILLVSLGVDTFKEDPIFQFKLKSEDYTEIGCRIEALGLTVHFVMEGGYAIDEVGVNTVNLLTGFESALLPVH
jgi:acetoin utilization deacetylase AcuC-like enzyme